MLDRIHKNISLSITIFLIIPLTVVSDDRNNCVTVIYCLLVAFLLNQNLYVCDWNPYKLNIS